MEATIAVSDDARLLDVMSLALNYHHWTFATVQPHIGRRVLEVGGGIGSLSAYLQDRERLVIIDVDPNCTARLHEQFDGRAGIRVLDGDILDRALVPILAAERPDTVICVNVLEHIDDDRTALRHMYEAIQPGGRLCLLVPAHAQLYGSLDQLVGHCRRYGRRELEEKARAAGFRIVDCRYFNSIGAFGWFVTGRLRRQQAMDDWQVRLYDRFVVPVLSRVERVMPPPFGQSLILIGAKDETG